MQPTQIKKGGKKEMWKRKKFIIPLVAAMALAGILAGSVFAQEGDEVGPPPGGTLIERLAEKLGIEQSELETAFAEVRSEMRDEAQSSRLEALVEQGKLTQEEADQFRGWWQARPEMELGGFGARLGGPGGHLGPAFGPRGQGGPGPLGGHGGCWGANSTS
jgi:hypothetical protein